MCVIVDQPPVVLNKQAFIETYDPYAIMSYQTRMDYINQTSWFILVDEQVNYLAEFLQHKRVIEIAAGTGYLAAHLRNRGVTQYKAFDSFSKCHPNDSVNYGVINRNALSVNLNWADVIIMTWPNYKSNLAEVIAKRMRKGQILIFQGEGEGGCTGNDRFYQYLSKESKFTELSYISRKLNHHQVNWCGMHDQFRVVKKLTKR